MGNEFALSPISIPDATPAEGRATSSASTFAHPVWPWRRIDAGGGEKKRFPPKTKSGQGEKMSADAPAATAG